MWLAQSNALDNYVKQSQIRDPQIIAMYRIAMDTAMENCNFAGDMLSKIYSYCQETNSVYEGGLAELNLYIAQGCAAFAAAGFNGDTGRWNVLDTSWQRPLATKALSVVETTLINRSLANPDQPYLSPDCQYIYCNGEKWRIDGGSVPGYVSKETGNQQWTSNWSDSSVIALSYEEFDTGMAFGLVSNALINAGQDASPKYYDKDGNTIAGLRGSRNARAAGTGANFASGALDGLIESNRSGAIVFLFQTRGNVDKRVSIFSSGDSTSYNLWRNRAYFSGTPDSSDSISQGTSLKDSAVASIMLNRKSDLASLYEVSTGKKPSEKLTIGAVFDDSSRNRKDAHTGQFVFTERGELLEKVVRYPNDKIIVFHGDEEVDATSAWFDIGYSPDELVKGEVTNALE